MQRGTYPLSKPPDIQIPMQMGGGFAGESSRRYTTHPCGLVVKKAIKVYRPKAVGLRCYETWELPDSKKYREGTKVRNERQKLRESQHRRTDMVKLPSDEERSILRASSKIDEGRKKFRRIGRSSSRYDRSELSKAEKVQTVLDLEKEEISFKRACTVETSFYPRFRRGFSATGDLDEQQSAWIPKTFQTETTLGVGQFQSWKDVDGDVFDGFLSDLYDSDGRTSS